VTASGNERDEDVRRSDVDLEAAVVGLVELSEDLGLEDRAEERVAFLGGRRSVESLLRFDETNDQSRDR
jgi:hypothetical protein